MPKLRLNQIILDYTRRARVARRAFCGLWNIIVDYEHNSNHNVSLTYLQNSQISPNSSKFCYFLAKSERFERDTRTEDARTDAGRTHSSNLRLTYTKSPSGNKGTWPTIEPLSVLTMKYGGIPKVGGREGTFTSELAASS